MVRPWRAFVVIVGSAAGLAANLPAHADGFRCGTRLVVEGTTRAQVRQWCGEPSDIATRTILRPPIIWRHGYPYHVGGSAIEVVVETWTYNLGPSKLMRRIRFEDSAVAEIETLGYGFHETRVSSR